MNFEYRFVEFGTRFTSAPGHRTDAAPEPQCLFQNELALDVGGACWGIQGETRPIIDHHFYWPERFPSAAAAVLHRAASLKERFGGDEPPEVFWLVTHRQPDFDAFTSMYLARCILDGTLPADGWQELGLRKEGWGRTCSEIDWYRPAVRDVDRQLRWGLLLASCASCADNCRPMSCPRHRALHSVLYAALIRGRNYLDVSSGATPFFDEVRRALCDGDRDLNPLFDSVLEQSDQFAPELALLDRQAAAYAQDIKRARRTIVYLQRSDQDFYEWYQAVSATPLLASFNDGRFAIAENQLQPAGPRRQQADGIYLRDPECLLFKEWVRNDIEHSSMGSGFLFTAVAYSDSSAGADVNSTAYFFALDPERADRCHLYNIWARLQASELAGLSARTEPADALSAACRTGYEQRAGELSGALFRDPWFDGANYECTLVVSPSGGSAIAPPGRASDLSDDAVAQIVQRELELSFLRGDVAAHDFSVSATGRKPVGHAVSVVDLLRGDVPRPAGDSYRFASVELDDDVEILQGTVGEQVGRLLWRLIDPAGGGGVPTDFLTRHLLRKEDWVAVWSRQGIVVAAKPGAREKVAAVERLFRELAGLAAETALLIHRQQADEETIDRCEALMRRAALARHELSLAEVVVVRRFFDATRLDEVLSTLRDINAAALQRQEAASDRQKLEEQRDLAAKMDANLQHVVRIQTVLHFIEYLVAIVYSVELWEALFRNSEPYHHAKHAIEHWVAARLGWLNVGGWFRLFQAFHWDLLIPAGLGMVLVMVINYNVEGHWVEWHWLKRLLRRKK